MTAEETRPPRKRRDLPVAPGWTAPRPCPAPRRADGLPLAVGAAIRRRRRERGLSQAALGAAIGRDHSTISRWESGERLPTLPALLALGLVLDCAPTALLPTSRESGVRSREVGGRS